MKVANLSTFGMAIDSTGAQEGAHDFDAATRQIEGAMDRAKRQVIVSQEAMQKALKETNGDLTAAARLVAETTEANEQGFTRVASAIERMRAAAARSADANLARQLAAQDPFARIAREAEDAARRTDGLRDSMRRMQAAGMASQIAVLDPFQKTAEAATKASFNVNGLRQAMTTLAVASGALPGALGRIGSSLGAFAVGGGVMVAALAGIAALGFAWEKLTEDTRKAREELEKHLDVLKAIKKEQDLGITGEAGAATSAGQAELARRRAELQEINRLIRAGPQFTGAGGGVTAGTSALEERRTKLIKEYVEIEALVRAGEKAVTKIVTAEATEREKVMRESIRRQRDELDAWAVDFYNKIPTVNELIRDHAESLAKADDEAKKLAATIQENLTKDIDKAFGQKMQDDMFSIIHGIGLYLDGLKEANEEAEKHRQIMKGMALGVLGGIFSRAGGPIGGAASGVIGAIASGAGGAGIAAAGISGLIEGIFGMGAAAEAQREKMRKLRIAYEEFTDTLNVQLGILDPLAAEIRKIEREMEDWRRQMGVHAEAIALFRRMNEQGILSDAKLAEYEAILAQINEQERQRIALLKQESTENQQRAFEDLAVRQLRALGREEEAEALADQIARERELADARARNATEAEILKIQEVQRIEAIAKAMEKVQAKIDSLNATISGLEDFRNALLLSDTQSPISTLAEARRQYEEILAKALEGDQAAAGRIPGAAQALLEASRAVNASGAGFQSDFAKVLADSQALIQKFTDLRTIEELMLEELKRIREGIELGYDEIIRFPGHQLPDGSGVETSAVNENLEAQIVVLQEGFRQTSSRLDEVVDGMQTLADATRQGFESIQLASRTRT